MALYRERRRREFLVTCPFNPAHQVKNGRFQIHIMKCEKAHPEMDMKHCPFSAEHVVHASDLMHHIFTCPLRTTVGRFLTASERDGPSGDTTMPPPTYFENYQEENWDEVATDAASLEDKFPTPAVAPAFSNAEAMAPAERRHYYASLHSLADEQVPADMRPHSVRHMRAPSPPLQNMDSHLDMPRTPTTDPKVLRDLVMVQRAAKAQYGDAAAGDESDTDDDDDNSDELEEPDRGQPYPMGVGRGCVVVPRAAADSEEEEDEEVRSSMWLLGLGRGLGRDLGRGLGRGLGWGLGRSRLL
ncbi:uncharacterized protein LOC144128018 [Amblyomma americanum]